jgi:DNA polymerase-3 subunit epsilon
VFAIVDIETCGGEFEFKKGRIIDICILVHDGLTVVDKFSTLINPECHISGFFTSISGITNEMVQHAPKFYEVAKDILQYTEGHIFVAHNVNFDYNFIKEEFSSLGFAFKREKLCTVKLGRKLLPGKKSYSLGNICAELNIEIQNRHRAEGDAIATAKLFDVLMQAKTMSKYKSTSIEDLMTTRIDKIKKYILDNLPEECGVYYFLNKELQIIYIGKSKNAYNRALSHFNTKENKGKKMLNDLYNVDFVATGSELIALLHESEEIKHHQPFYNRARKQEVSTHSILNFINEDGIVCFYIDEYYEKAAPLASFNNYLSARETLDNWIDTYALCIKYCGLTSDEAICFNHQIKKCNGICAGLEEITIYNKRANKLINDNSYKKPTFAIIDKGRNVDEYAIVLVENNKYVGYGYFTLSDTIASFDDAKDIIQTKNYHADADVLIKSWLRQNTNVKIIAF